MPRPRSNTNRDRCRDVLARLYQQCRQQGASRNRFRIPHPLQIHVRCQTRRDGKGPDDQRGIRGQIAPRQNIKPCRVEVTFSAGAGGRRAATGEDPFRVLHRRNRLVGSVRLRRAIGRSSKADVTSYLNRRCHRLPTPRRQRDRPGREVESIQPARSGFRHS